MKEIIRCDACGITLQVGQKAGEKERVIRCPNCSHQLRVVFHDNPEADAAGTVYAGMAKAAPQPACPRQEDGSTVYAAPKAVHGGQLQLDGHFYTLHPGRNIVGRKAATSEADIQIETDDHSMSRMHALINLTRVADGRLKALVSAYRNKNALLVNGHPLAEGDEVVLRSGDQLTMGNTTLHYTES